MPQKMWKHSCSQGGNFNWIGEPVCRSCGGPGAYDGWFARTHESMASYQNQYGLKPIGPHRRMADELFGPVKKKCGACDGRGLRDTADGSSWQVCDICQGFGSFFTRPADEIEALRHRVLATYPDAGADPVPGFFTGVLAFSEAKKAVVDLSVFDGYPYLVTRVVPATYHMTLLPGDVGELELAGIARTQWRANRLDVCLVIGPRRALYISADGVDRLLRTPPRGGIPIAGKLKPPSSWPDTADLQARQRRLASFIESSTPKGDYGMFGDLTKGGREASADDVARLAGSGPEGVPRGLERCATCSELRGICLDPSPEFFCKVVTVHCRCQNDNRCAACGQLLYKRKLNANYYKPSDGKIWHVPGFSGLYHRCLLPPCKR